MKYHINYKGELKPCYAKIKCRYNNVFTDKNEALIYQIKLKMEIEKYNDIIKNEPIITEIITTIANINNVKLSGLENKLKTLESTLYKIFTRGELKTVTEAYDIIRYTMIINKNEYYKKKNIILRQLQKQEIEIVEEKDYWNNNEYKGINEKLLLKIKNQKFELQFHTPESLLAKNKSHKYYEIKRNPMSSPKQINQAFKKIIEIYKNVKI
jgi:hypothetical protein